MSEWDELTSVFRLDTKMVHLSFVPVIPGGRPPPKAAAIAAALFRWAMDFRLSWQYIF